MKNNWYSIVVSLLLVSFFGHATEQSSTQKPNLYYFFCSPVYEDYLAELNRTLYSFTSSLDEADENHPFISKIIQFSKQAQIEPSTFEDRRALHQELLTKLRELIAIKEFYEEGSQADLRGAIPLIDDLCMKIFTIDLTDPCLAFLRDHELELLGVDSFQLFGLENVLTKIYSRFIQDTSYGGHLLHSDEMLDLHYEGYQPSYLFEAFSSSFILMPRPTLENRANTDVAINPEFLTYLRALKKQGKRHLYINLMNRHGLGQKMRSLAIEKLGEQEEFKDTLQVVTLDRTSDFYWQKGLGNSSSNAEEFKQVFEKKLFEVDPEIALYKWPNQLGLAQWQERCHEVLDRVHSHCFAKQVELSIEERQDFIEISLVEIIQMLCQQFKPHYANASCKSTVDRGPSFLALLYAYSRLEASRECSIKDQILLATILFAPPMLSHNRPCHDYRLNRFISAYSRLGFNTLSYLK